jgi:hypothetical protein
MPSRLSQDEVERRCAAIGLTLLEPYVRARRGVKVRCNACGREWRAGARFLYGRGCAHCHWNAAGRTRALSQATVERLFAHVGLTPLEPYLRSAQLIQTRCNACRHTWRPQAGNVLSGHGCPVCHPPGSTGEGERLTRGLFERLTGWRFPKARPAWLRGERQLELDGYNCRHQVAFEYQGEHHYIPVFGHDGLARHQRNDTRKRRLCRKHGVALIAIPYWEKDNRKFVEARLEAARVSR